MCFIALAVNAHRDLPLIVCANRDEFYERPTERAHYWRDQPSILGGRDALHGGTWLAVDRSGRFSAVTNIRGGTFRPNAPSRGTLVSDYLQGELTPEQYLSGLRDALADYNGVNVLCGDTEGVWFASSAAPQPIALDDSVNGLSNASLNTPWPKVASGRRQLAAEIESANSPNVESFLALLTDRKQPQEDRLPDTGVGIARERVLAPIFIDGYARNADYGTRSSTVLTRSTNGELRFREVTWRRVGSGQCGGGMSTGHSQGQSIDFRFTLEPKSRRA